MWLFKRNKKIKESNIKNKGEIFEEKLLKEYGPCRPNIKYGLKVLFITDTHNCLAYTDKYINYLKSLNQEDYDICLILGDLSGLDFDSIKSIIPKDFHLIRGFVP